jgi:hypothetical protein
MYAVAQRSDGMLTNVEGFEHEVTTGRRTFYFVGTIEGLVQRDYTIERNIGVHDITSDLRNCLPRINGRYVGIAVCDGRFEFAASDIGAVEELYYSTTETELILSTDFFRLARVKEQLDYDASEVLFFARRGYCHKGKTTFVGVHRLPPGDSLKLNIDGTVVAESYLDEFKGTGVTFEVFKNAINHAIGSAVQNDASLDEVVTFSGGVDSSVLLSLVRNIKDVTAVTYSFVPALNWNAPDTLRAERIAKKLHVPHAVVDVDLNEIRLRYLNDVIASMPFAAHLSINFKKMFEALQSRKRRLWCGQDLDNLYNYGATMDLQVINRFVLSDTYGRMLHGINGAQRYRPAKKLLDASLKLIGRSYYKQRFETPDTFDELIEYLNESDRQLALRVAGVENHERMASIAPSEDINVSEIRNALFDDRLGGYCTGNEHKIQIQATKLFGTKMILAYSTPGIVHMLRNLHLSTLDVLIAKRFMYRYARTLGLSKRDFRLGWSLQTPGASQNWLEVFESTSFGQELSREADKAADRIGLILDPSDKNRWQKEVGMLWISKVCERLHQDGVDLKGPAFAKGKVRV